MTIGVTVDKQTYFILFGAAALVAIVAFVMSVLTPEE